jgi:S-methylmethionine-dependent homocysteine/selenocysteine methylase/SAM-dependent methyltransferase
MRSVAGKSAPSGAAYDAVRTLLQERCLILDGRSGLQPPRQRALVETPEAVVGLHKRFVRAGADVITASGWEPAPGSGARWLERARRSVQLARQAVAHTSTAVALAIDADVLGPDSAETIELVSRALATDPPDLVLVETLSAVRPSLFATAEALLATGLPVWLSFRRCPQGLCGEHGEHPGGPDGDTFGRAAHRLEQLGVSALLINGIPPDHVDGMVGYLREFTDLPLGVYPNLGYRTSDGWRHAGGVSPKAYANLALRWRAEGAQIIGGGSGVQPMHIAATAGALVRAPAGVPRRTPAKPPPAPEPWQTEGERPLYPLAFPDLAGHPDVFKPMQGSFLLWRHLYRERIGRDASCLDVGCGSGLQAIQLALNGATRVHALESTLRAAELTKTNAFRNGVADRIRAEAADLLAWVPDERYDVIAASILQLPVTESDAPVLGRPADFWGRTLLDHLIAVLPDALADGGVAHLLHVSVLSQERTAELLARHGLKARVVDFGFLPFSDGWRRSAEQIAHVERLSDAYHLRVAGDDVIVAYLLEVTRARPRAPRRSRRAS